MHSISRSIAVILNTFSILFTLPTWEHMQILLVGSILCQGVRRVSSILRVMGLAREKRFEKYHRVFNRAKWNSVAGAKILLGLLLQLLPAKFPPLIVVDETIERRKGKKISAKGCYRDACRSTERTVIKCVGLKWICLMLIVPLPWSSRPWALPFMTILAPTKQYHEKRGRQHKTSIDWTIIALRIISRWLRRSWTLLGDGGFACIRLGHVCRKNNVTLISRLRLDAALYDFALPPISGQRGRHREKGIRSSALAKLTHHITTDGQEVYVTWYGGMKKQLRMLSGVNLWYSSGEKPLPIRWVLVIDPSKNKSEAFFSTDLNLSPQQIINSYVLRWNIEVTFEEVRARLGMETQRQWSERAIARTTPTLLSLFSFVCLFGKEILQTQALPILSTAWYDKKGEATFSDILAIVRRNILVSSYFNDSVVEADYVKIKTQQWESLLDQLCLAA